jgi:protein-tyrosine phosphatase
VHYLGYLRPSAATVVSVMMLLADSEAPAIVHCAAGKDRTGVMAALLLGAVGTPVPDGTLSRLTDRLVEH